MNSTQNDGTLAAVSQYSSRQVQIFQRLAAASSLTLLLAVSACQESEEETPTDAAAPPAAETSPARPTPQDPVGHVPVGDFLVGSSPGDPGRNPGLEPLESKVQLGPFRMDTYPYPGKGKPPRTGVSKKEASALCSAKKGRLCTELEWERACRGPGSAMYAGGKKPCDGDNCVSGFDIVGLGAMPEWTASTFGKQSSAAGKSVVRGAPTGLPANERRCARRATATSDQSVGFRCCYGAPNAASLSEPSLGPAYKEVALELKDLKELLASDERTKDLAETARLFKPEAARTVLARGPGDTKGFKLTTQAVEWQPARGARFLVVAGHASERRSFVVAYYLGAKKTLAGSFLMSSEPGPLALAYANSIRPRIHFSSCWGCPGETGKVLFREPEELVLLQP